MFGKKCLIILEALLVLNTTCLCAGKGKKKVPSLKHFGWQLYRADPKGIDYTIERAKEYGVTEIRLSHGIIVAVDQINSNKRTLELVNKVSRKCDEYGMDTFVWAKELNIGKNKVWTDLNPKGKLWIKRQKAYSDAFKNCPSLDGVVLQFGSCPTEIWFVPPVSIYNARSSAADRIVLTTSKIQEICNKFNKKLDIRTFNHSPYEQNCLRKAFPNIKDVRPMCKEVPQDWQPYYPQNDLIGDTGGNKCIVEFDLCGEYWGVNYIPFAMPDYLVHRIRNMFPKKIIGVVTRIARGNGLPTLGSTNEINIYAMSRLVRNPMIDANTIWRDWVQKRYKIDPDSKEGIALISSLRRTFDTNRKMFYVLNQWALEKSSYIPDRIRTGCLYSKNTAQWNSNYMKLWRELCLPDSIVLKRIWQEKSEAVESARKSLAELEIAKSGMSSSDYEDLKKEMTDNEFYTKVWRLATDAIFRSLVYRRDSDPIHRSKLEYDARELLKLSNASGEKRHLATQKRIKSFVKSLRTGFKVSEVAAIPETIEISNVKVEYTSPETVTVSWRTASSGESFLYWGEELPILQNKIRATSDSNKHVAKVRISHPDKRYAFRIEIGNSQSGDFYIIPQN